MLYLGVRVVEAILRWHPPMAHHNLQLRGFHDSNFDASSPVGYGLCSKRGNAVFAERLKSNQNKR